MGVKEVPQPIIPNKTYLFFSTVKNSHSTTDLHGVKNITLIDYELLTNAGASASWPLGAT
jgi:hypothetical protein